MDPQLCDRQLRDRLWPALAVALALFAAALVLAQGLRPCDDAYITFRHVKNLAAEGRPAWNLEGDPVMGSTAPLLVLGLGAVAMVTGPESIETVALWSNALASFALVLLVYLVARTWLRRPEAALACAALVGLHSGTIYVASLGFEAVWLAVVGLGALLAVQHGSEKIALVLASLAPLLRPEGILFCVPVWLVILGRRRFAPAQLAAFGLVPLVWVVFATAYYGSPIPHSIHAKRMTPVVFRPYQDDGVDLVARVAEVPAAAAELLEKNAGAVLVSGSLELERWNGLHTGIAALLAFGFAWALGTALVKRDARWIHLWYAPAFLLLYAWIGKTEVWYFPSFLVFATLGGFLGAARALETILPLRGLWTAAPTAALFALLLGASAYTWEGSAGESRLLPLARDPRGADWEEWEQGRYETYREAAEFLNEREHGTALISEIGFFGYFYEGPVLDACGICSPEALAFYPPPREDIYDEEGNYRAPANNLVPTRMVMELRPKYVVNSLVYIANLLRPSTPMRHAYGAFAPFGNVWNHPLQIFQRLDDAPGTGDPGEAVSAARASGSE